MPYTPEQRRAYYRAYRQDPQHQAKERVRLASPAYKEKKREREARRYAGRVPMRFVAFDGEGSEGRYQLLACSATDKVLQAEEGLTTIQCLWYLASLRMENIIRQSDCLIGFGLSYDFENMLRDVPDADIALMVGEGKTINYKGFALRYVQHKYLDVRWHVQSQTYSLRLQDIFPYFQQSFVRACAERHIDLPEIVLEGKKKRSSFDYKDIDNIILYNRAELEAMVRLAQSLYDDFKLAFEALELRIPMHRLTFYGPGAQAGPVLRAMAYLQDFVIEVSQVMLSYMTPGLTMLPPTPSRNRGIRSIMYDPFTYAYFGGRIESAVQGRLKVPLYDYDLISAYPYAMTRLPALTNTRLVQVQGLDVADRIGIYHIGWKSKGDEIPFHPFPYRNLGGNVFYPPSGTGWFLSPEVLIVDRDDYEIEILEGFVFEQTEGFGRGDRQGTSQVATFVKALGEIRTQLKQQGNPGHRGLKLVMNSLYGKTLQRVGAHPFYNAFIAAWITSVTRARLYQAIRHQEPGVVVSVMTDGILATQPLPLELGSDLGGWELSRYPNGIQFVPGIYVLNQYGHGKPIVRYRGYARFDVRAALHAMDNGTPFVNESTVFVTRGLSQHVKELGDKRYRFVPHHKEDSFTLGSKRDMTQPKKLPYGAFYYPAKRLSAWAASLPYQGVLAPVDAPFGGRGA